MNPNNSQHQGNTDASWEEIADKGTPSTVTQDKPKKERKPLKLPGKNVEFKPSEESGDAINIFFKEELDAFQNSSKQGKMFQNALSSVTIPAKPSEKSQILEIKKTVNKDNKKDTKAEPPQEKIPKRLQKEKEAGKDKEKDGKEESKSDRNYKKLQGLASNQKSAKKEVIDLEVAIKDKNKYDDLVDESRSPMNIVFIGHVDAGKSTICGNILLITGQIDQNDVRKLQIEAKENNRESWYLAYIMDINEEEKAKGKTVEVGKARFNTDKKRFTILDAPGHKNYVPNMIAGASQADIATLVISAKTGEFESGFDKGGQTREHAMLAKALGVQKLIVAVNKMDDVGWSEKRFTEIRDTLTPYLKGACGYNMQDVIFVPIAGLHGENMKEPVKSSNASWYKGATLFQTFDDIELAKRDENGPIRIPVLDKFKETGAVYIFGKVESGTIVPGLSVTLVPLGEQITIHAIYNNDDRRVPYAKPGEGVKLHVKGIEGENISKGDVICSNWNFTQITNVMECEIVITELPEHKPIMSSGYSCVMHIHSALEEVFIKEIMAEYDKDKNPKTAKFLRSGSVGIVRIESTSAPICCEKYDVMPQLGRFTLRDEGKTIATGIIKKVKPLWKD